MKLLVTNDFTGREKELSTLKKIWELVLSQKKPKVILVQGDFGSGKTSLISKFLQDIGTKKYLIGLAQCALESKDNGLVPFVQLTDTIGKQTEKFQTTISGMLKIITEIAPAWIDIFTAGAATNISEAASKTISVGKTLFPDKKITLDNIFVQFTNFILNITKNRPTIIFIDDIHWSDVSSLSLIFHLSRYLKDRAIMIILTYRPVEGLETGANTKTLREIRANLIRYGAIELNLTEGLSVHEYIRKRYPHNKFSPELINKIIDQGDGHALYTSQLFTWLEETETIIKQDENWLAKTDIELIIPSSIGEVLNERMQLMGENLRDTLKIASVQGEDFTAQIVSKLHNLNELEILNLLDLLEKRYKLVKEDHTEELDSKILDFYRFLHRFFREHIYQNLSSGQKRLLHKKVGDYLESLYEKNTLPISGLLAKHFFEAKELEKSIHYAMLASRQEALRFAWNESLEWCLFGLSSINLNQKFKNTKNHFLLLYQIGVANFRLGNWEHAHTYLSEALEVCKATKIEIEQQIEINTLLVEVAENENDISLANELVKKSRLLLSKIQKGFQSELSFKVELSDAIVKIWQGKNKDAVTILNKALKKTEANKQTKEMTYKIAIAYNYLSLALSNLNKYKEAQKAFNKTILIAREIEDKSLEAMGLTSLVEEEIYHGKLTENLPLINKAVKLAKISGDRETESYALAIRGHLYLVSGQLTEATKSLNKSLRICNEIQTEWNLALIYSDLAQVYLRLDQIKKAEEFSSMAVEYGRKGYKYLLGVSLDVKGQVDTVLSRWQEAEKNFLESIMVFEESKDLHLASLVRLNYADALSKQNKKMDALVVLDKALETLKDLGLSNEVEKTKKMRREILR